MGGLNSLSGLNNMSVDFWSTFRLDAQSKVDRNTLQSTDNVGSQNAQPVKAEAKSVVCQLDVLLLNAAGKLVSADAQKSKVADMGKNLVDLGVLSSKEAKKLNDLAQDAAAKLKVLDRISGRDLAKALMKTTEKVEDWSGVDLKDKTARPTTVDKEIVDWDTNKKNAVAKAVKAAIAAQEALSGALDKFNKRLAADGRVDGALQDEFMDLQFQCDRRASEIDSIVFKMFDLVQKDVVDGRDDDPQIKALLDAKFKELLPREAIAMHGTAEDFEVIGRTDTAVDQTKTIRDMFRPLAEKLDAFTTDGSKILTNDDLNDLRTSITEMHNAIDNVRKNGINVRTDVVGEDKKSVASRTEVDRSLLDAMEKVLVDAQRHLNGAKNVLVVRSRQAFMQELCDSLYAETKGSAGRRLEGGGRGRSFVSDFNQARKKLVDTLQRFATDQMDMEDFDSRIDDCIAAFDRESLWNLKDKLQQLGVRQDVAQDLDNMVKGLRVVKEQFRNMMNATARVQDSQDGDLGIAASDVRRILLGEVGLSNVVEAKIRGFKPGDVDAAAEGQNIVGSRFLGSGVVGKTYLLTTKTGGELVFKPDLDSRIGLSRLTLGSCGAYKAAQNTANLNLATQDTAKAFGCEDLVVKYSVGSHDGQFGFFMEKAKGFSGRDFASTKKKSQGEGLTPADLHKITDDRERAKIQGQIAKKLNKLMWLDLITGQGDRHWNNYFVHIDKETHAVTVKAIDNDASFTERQVGLQKYTFTKEGYRRFQEKLTTVCMNLHGKDGQGISERLGMIGGGITSNDNGTTTIDLAEVKSPEVKMAVSYAVGMKSIALPEEIDAEFYDKLMAMDRDSAKKEAFFQSIAPRISPEALEATKTRLDEAIAHAKKLKTEGKVYGNEKWMDGETINRMPEVKSSVTIKKVDNTEVELSSEIDDVNAYCVNSCPSYYKRDYFQKMFNEPQLVVQ